LAIAGTNSVVGGPTTLTQGELMVVGKLTTTVLNTAGGTKLSGSGDGAATGVIVGPVNVSGTLSPGSQGYPTSNTSNTGILTTGDVTFTGAGSIFEVNINSGTPAPGTTYDQLSASKVTINDGAIISATGTFTTSPGTPITLIDVAGTDGNNMTGDFDNLADPGGQILLNGNTLVAFYDGGPPGTDNNLVLLAGLRTDDPNPGDGADTWEIRRTTLNGNQVELLLNNTVIQTATFPIVSWAINGLDGDDTLLIN
jgi:hypothetical protein